MRWGRELDSVASFRLGKATHARVRELAAAARMSVSDWIRSAVEREVAELADVEVQVGAPFIGGTTVRLPAALFRDAAKAELERQAYRPRTFTCAHATIGGVMSAQCGTCGPMSVAA